jgi:hypothetical protein
MPRRSEAGLVKLSGPGGATVEGVTYTDKRGHLVRVLRLRRHGVHVGDFGTVEELAAHVDLSQLQDEPIGPA